MWKFVVFTASCMKTKEVILDRSISTPPTWTTERILEDNQHYYFVGKRIAPTIQRIDARKNCKALLKIVEKDATFIYKKAKKVVGKDEADYLKEKFITNTVDNMVSSLVKRDNTYWEYILTASKEGEERQYHTYVLVSMDKFMLRSFENRVLQLQIRSARIDNNKALETFLLKKQASFNAMQKEKEKNQKRVFVLNIHDKLRSKI